MTFKEKEHFHQIHPKLVVEFALGSLLPRWAWLHSLC